MNNLYTEIDTRTLTPEKLLKLLKLGVKITSKTSSIECLNGYVVTRTFDIFDEELEFNLLLDEMLIYLNRPNSKYKLDFSKYILNEISSVLND